jgi:hypothetical protein
MPLWEGMWSMLFGGLFYFFVGNTLILCYLSIILLAYRYHFIKTIINCFLISSNVFPVFERAAKNQPIDKLHGDYRI